MSCVHKYNQLKQPTHKPSPAPQLHGKMRAIQATSFGDVDVLQLNTDLREPEPGKGEIVVKVECAGINPVDTYIRMGMFPIKPTLPYIPGQDGAGVVHKVGEGVSNAQIGSRVWFINSPRLPTGGTLAEYIVMDAKLAIPLHESLSFAQGAALATPYITAYRALFTKGRAESGKMVLIHGGSGAVGVASIQLAKAHGCIVLATAGTEKGLQLIKELGADHIFNHREEGYVKKINEIIGTGGIQVIIEMVGNANLGVDLTLLGPGGRVAVIGSRGTVEVDPRFIIGPETEIHGVNLGSCTPQEFMAGVMYINKCIGEGKAVPIIAKEYTLSDAAQAHKDVLTQPGGAAGKLVVNCQK